MNATSVDTVSTQPAALKVLQPEASDSASIAAAIARGEAAEAEARSNAEKAKESWSRLLLTADDAQMDELERATSKFLRDADRIAAALPQLRQDLEAARKREVREMAVRLVEQANAAGRIFMASWRDSYLALANQLAAILRQEEAAIQLRAKAYAAAKALPDDDKEGLPALVDVAGELFDGPAVMGLLIQLPNLDGTLGGAPWFDPRRAVRASSPAGQYTRNREEKQRQQAEAERQRIFKENRQKQMEAEQARIGSHGYPKGYAGTSVPQRVTIDRVG